MPAPAAPLFWLAMFELANENSTKFRHLSRNTRILGLIRLELAVEEKKIGGTTPMLAASPDPNKPKLFRLGARRDADNALRLEN